MRVAIYIRVSTKLQETKFSLAAQEKELIKYAQSMSWEIVVILKDVDSGGKLDKSGLNSLLDLADEGKIDVVLCIDQDRLSRLDTIAWEYLKSALRENGVKIAEPGRVVDLNNEDDEFISDIKNLIAKREKRAIVRRMMRGKRQKMREGEPWGKPPLEYEYNPKTSRYEIKEEWAWVIPFIDNLYLNEQLGMTSISDKLNEISKSPTGKLWNEHLLHTRLESKAYHGVMEKTFSNGETITLEGVYDPVRTEETYKRIQLEKKNRNERYSVTGRRGNNVHMLKRTKLVCGECGRVINIAQHGTKISPRHYAKHGRKLSISNGYNCDMNINTVRFDTNIITALKDLLSSEEQAKKYINLDIDENEVESIKTNIKKLSKKISELQESHDRLLDLYVIGKLKKEKYLEKETEIESQIELHKIALDQHKLKLETVEGSTWNYEMLYEYLELASEIETELTPLERAQLVGKLFPTGKLYRDKLVLTTEVFKGIPIEVAIKIEPDPFTWHKTKQKGETSTK